MFKSITKKEFKKMIVIYNYLMKEMNARKEERNYVIAYEEEKGIHLFNTFFDKENKIYYIRVWSEKGKIKYEIE